MGPKAADLLDSLVSAGPRVLLALGVVVVGYLVSRALRWVLHRLRCWVIWIL